MNLDDFSYIDNDRRYVNPQVSLNEQNAFIDNLRNTQGQNTAQIRQDTYNLGTAVPSNLGGLAGGSNYFKSRYQTPQTNSMVADLRAAAQSQALSTLLSNEIGKAQKRYNDAYRAAQKRANNAGGGNDPSDYLENLKLQTEDDGSGDMQNVVEHEGEYLPDLEAQLRIKQGQLEQMKKKGFDPTAGLRCYEKINPIAYIGAFNIWVGQYNRLNDEIKDLEGRIQNGE